MMPTNGIKVETIHRNENPANSPALRWHGKTVDRILGVDHLNPSLMAAAFEGRGEPRVDNREDVTLINHPFANRQAVGVVVHPAKAGRLHVPAERAANAFHSVSDDGFAV